MKNENYDDPKVEARWLAEQRAHVLRYLRAQGVRHRGVARKPAWFIAPCLAVWAVQSAARPGWLGWWGISGDVPTDYLSGRDAGDARAALRAFSARWQEVSAYMLRGEKHPEVCIGQPEQWPELGELLARRAETMLDFADDDGLW
jgi:hypothetical protein